MGEITKVQTGGLLSPKSANWMARTTIRGIHRQYLVTRADFVKQAVYWDTCYHVTKNGIGKIQAFEENDLLITRLDDW